MFKKALRYRNPQADGEVNMTPMLDIVFIMLIFFIVTTSFEQEAAVDIRPLRSSQTDTNEESQVKSIELLSNGLVEMDGQTLSMTQIAARLGVWKINKAQPAVVIVVSSEAPTHSLVALNDQVRLADIDNIKVAVARN